MNCCDLKKLAIRNHWFVAAFFVLGVCFLERLSGAESSPPTPPTATATQGVNASVSSAPNEPASNDIKNVIQKTPCWITVTFILTVSGGVGGFGWHLIRNRGSFIFPCSEKIQRGQTKHTAWFLGGIGDIAVAAVTANSIHFAIAGIVDYARLAKGDSDSDRVFFSIIALGILSGFSGAPLLRSLSKRLVDSLTPEEKEELKKEVVNMVEVQTDALMHAEGALNRAAAGKGSLVDLVHAKEALIQLCDKDENLRIRRIFGIFLGRLHRWSQDLTGAANELNKSLHIRRKNNIPKDLTDAAYLFNLACYKSLLGAKHSPGEEQQKIFIAAWDALKESVSIDEQNLIEARTDGDLESLRAWRSVDELKKT